MLKRLKKSLDFKLIGLICLFYTVVSIVSLARVTYLKLNGYAYESFEWSSILLKVYGYDWILFMLFTIFITYTTKKMIEKKASWSFIIITHLFFSIIFSAFTYFGSLSISIILGDYDISDMNVKNSLFNLVRNMDYNFILYFATISIIYVHNYLNQIKQAQIQHLQLESLLTNTKIKTLKSQLQPHFLFNTLHSIHSLLDVDIIKSKKMIVDLSELLREIIDYKEDFLISLKEEINLLNKYLSIIKVRFSEDLKIDLNYDNSIDNALVPSMLLQPIVENSIKHGYSLENIKLKLLINIYKAGNTIVIYINNDGKKLSHSFDEIINKGLGVKNTLDRLKILYNTNFSFEIYNDIKGVTTKIIIPFQTND